MMASTLGSNEGIVSTANLVVDVVDSRQPPRCCWSPARWVVASALSNRIIVGNLQDRGNWSLEPDPDVLQRSVQAAIDFFSLMRPPAPGARLTRSEPPQAMPSVNTFFDVES
jgi:hypothetical protein